MRANTDETLRRGAALREKHGSWVKASRTLGEAVSGLPLAEEHPPREADFLARLD